MFCVVLFSTLLEHGSWEKKKMAAEERKRKKSGGYGFFFDSKYSIKAVRKLPRRCFSNLTLASKQSHASCRIRSIPSGTGCSRVDSAGRSWGSGSSSKMISKMLSSQWSSSIYATVGRVTTPCVSFTNTSKGEWKRGEEMKEGRRRSRKDCMTAAMELGVEKDVFVESTGGEDGDRSSRWEKVWRGDKSWKSAAHPASDELACDTSRRSRERK